MKRRWLVFVVLGGGCTPQMMGNAGAPDLGAADLAATDLAAADLGDTGGDLASVPLGAGHISVSSTSSRYAGMQLHTTGIVPAFVVGAKGFVSGCIVTPMGGCELIVCTPPVAPEVSAGTIQVTGGFRVVQANWGGKKYLYLNDPTATLWNGGEQLTIAAAGDTVPAFKTTLEAPTQAIATSPTLVAWNQVDTRQRANPINFAWTGADSSEFVGSAGVSSGNTETTIRCSWPGIAHSGQIPAVLLMLLPAGEGPLGAYTRNQTVVSSGGWRVNVDAESGVVTGGGDTLYELVNWQ